MITQTLSDAIESRFIAAGLNTTLGAALWAGSAPEGTPFPFAVYDIPSAPSTPFYGTDTADDVAVNFTAYHVGREAAATACAALLAAYKDQLLTLSAGHVTNVVVTMNPLPRDMGRTASTVDDANFGPVWGWTFSLRYSAGV